MTRGARAWSRRVGALLAAASLAAACSRRSHDAALPARTGVLESDALALVERYDAAWSRKDWAMLEKVLARDYVYFSSKGDVSDRAATKQLVTSPVYRLDRGERTEQKTYRSGSTVVVSSHWIGAGVFDGKPFADDQRCSVVVAFADGKGRVLSEHCTNLAAPGAVVPANTP